MNVHETEIYKTEIYKDHEIKIVIDDSPANPRTNWDNLGTMVCFRNYNLGDKDHGYDKDELLELVARKDVIALPVYMYEHGGIVLQTTPFSCRDSGQVGFIYIIKKRAIEEMADRIGNTNKLKSWKYITKKRLERIKDVLRSEVETYSQYINGDVYGYIVANDDDDHIDSCWGFYGYDFENNGLMEYARNVIDCLDSVREKERTGKLLALQTEIEFVANENNLMLETNG